MSAGAVMRFAGYAALFDIPDAGHDIIRKGAFAHCLAARESPLPLFWQHRASAQLGKIEQIAEDERGLRVIASIDQPHSRAVNLLRAGQISGLSFGYRAKQFRRSKGIRELFEIELFEISLVSDPLQHRARVHLIS